MAKELSVARVLTDAELDFLGDSALYADIGPEQDRQWVASAHHYAQRAASGTASEAERALFWVRFIGILEITREQRQQLERAEELFHPEGVNGRPEFDHCRLFLDASRQLLAALTPEELFYAEYRRHVECHPRQHHFRARLDPKGKLLPVQAKTTGETLSQDDSEERLRAMIRHYGGEVPIAQALATRLLPALERLAHALTDASRKT